MTEQPQQPEGQPVNQVKPHVLIALEQNPQGGQGVSIQSNITPNPVGWNTIVQMLQLALRQATIEAHQVQTGQKSQIVVPQLQVNGRIQA